MTIDLRYDGPDVEGESSTRRDALLTAAIIAKQGLGAGLGERATRASERDAAAAAAEQMVWRDTPTGPELGGLGDDALAVRWSACAAHPGQTDATEVRTRIEAELDRRDPETMRDYRSWRNAAGLAPGEAMRRALAEREERLRGQWQPLLTGAGRMDTGEVVSRWAAAHAAHGLGEETAEQLRQARQVGQDRLAELDPQRLRAWAGMTAEQPSTVKDLSRPGLSEAEAAARTAGRPPAFLPGPGGSGSGWGKVASTGVTVATTTARAAAATNPATAGLAVAQTTADIARRAHQLLTRGVTS